MKTIWKYEISAAERQSILMPAMAEVLCLQLQAGVPYIWALVDPGDARTEREFILLGTGHNVTPQSLGRYVGTFQTSGGALVFHLFEAK